MTARPCSHTCVLGSPQTQKSLSACLIFTKLRFWLSCKRTYNFGNTSNLKWILLTKRANLNFTIENTNGWRLIQWKIIWLSLINSWVIRWARSPLEYVHFCWISVYFLALQLSWLLLYPSDIVWELWLTDHCNQLQKKMQYITYNTRCNTIIQPMNFIDSTEFCMYVFVRLLW